MIVRKRNRPKVLQKTEALISRLPAKHQALPILHGEAAKRQAGYNGERKFDYYANLFPRQYAILHDITLNVDQVDLQLDSIILSNQAIYIIEVKNYAGTVVFDTNLNQCIRDNGETLEGFDDPVIQVKNAELLLKKWLFDKQLEELPVYSFIAFANEKAIVKIEGGTKINNLTRVNAIPNLIMDFDDTLPKKKPYLKEKVIPHLLKECKDFDFDLFKKYNIQQSDIQSGVQCLACNTLTMKWHRRYWRCQKCHNRSENAHLKALKDYQLLIGNDITNAQSREFLQLNCRFASRRFLQKANYQLKDKSKTWIPKGRL